MVDDSQMIVERESECSTLYDLINGAIESNQGCIINLCGQPSVGKTVIGKFIINKIIYDDKMKKINQKNNKNNDNIQIKRTSSGLRKLKNNAPPIASVPSVLTSTLGNDFVSMYKAAIRGKEETMLIFFIDECDLACNLHACSNHSAGMYIYNYIQLYLFL